MASCSHWGLFPEPTKPEASTWVTIRGRDGELVSSWVNHRRDLSDLGEPYLSAVQRSRRLKQIPGYTLLNVP